MLLLALVLPLVLATYLKYCTTAHFDVPVKFISGHLPPAGCNAVTVKPYAIPDSIRAKLNWDSRKKLTCLLLPFSSDERTRRLRRVREFQDEVAILEVDSLNFELNHCYLFMSRDSATMLTDQQGQVRGYYADNLKESDRLITEISILLQH